METLFLNLVNLSITASWLVLAVVVFRIVFKEAPKWLFCLLWGMVALRLIVPFSIESNLSLIPTAEPLPAEIIYTAQPQIHSGIEIVDRTVNPLLIQSMTPAPEASAKPTQIWSFLLAQVWLIGMAVMLLYTAATALLLKYRLQTATPLQKGIKQSEVVDSPFVLGILRPVIYLPYQLEPTDMHYVIAHEQAHIHRKDHWWKPIGFCILSVYWFNPVLWLAYILFCRDVEAACDEKVIRDMPLEGRQAYSTALLNLSIRRGRIAACPLAFGETGVKERIKSVMYYKKPAVWIVLSAVIVSAAIAVGFLTNPEGPFSLEPGLYKGIERVYYKPYDNELHEDLYLEWFVDDNNRLYSVSGREASYLVEHWEYNGVLKANDAFTDLPIQREENRWEGSKPKSVTGAYTVDAFAGILYGAVFRTADHQLYSAEWVQHFDSGEMELHSIWKLQWEACPQLPIPMEEQSITPEKAWELLDSIVITPFQESGKPGITITYPEELNTEDFHCSFYAIEPDGSAQSIYSRLSQPGKPELELTQTFSDLGQYEVISLRFYYDQNSNELARRREDIRLADVLN